MGKEFMPYSKIDPDKKTLIIFGEKQSWEFDGLTFTPRPSEPKKLWEIIKSEHLKHYYIGPSGEGNGWEHIAKAAKEWFVELVESIDSFPSGHQYFKSELLKRIQEF